MSEGNKWLGKKRKIRSSPEIEKEKENAETSPSATQQQSKEPKEQVTPSLNTTSVTDCSVITALMRTEEEYSETNLNKGVSKINTTDSDTYWTMTAKLKESEIQWHTYKNKTLKPIKGMTRGFHETFSKVNIMEDLKEKWI